jgi:phosphatidylserine/phosphatidylglycerophosphate/cardiolipin synthase-like enzyme
MRSMLRLLATLGSVVAIACTHHVANNGDDDGDDDITDDGGDTTDGTTPTDDGGTTDATQPTDGAIQTSNAITIIVEPNGNDGSEIVNAIKAAKTSVHMTMYLLTSTDVINALIARHKAGVEVKVLLDSSSQTDNTDVYNQLKSAGVSVAWSSTTFTYTHEKCVIIDAAVAWIMTMNLTQSSPSSNREYLAIDTSATDISEAETIFEGDFAGSPPGSVNGPLMVAPINAVTDVVSLIQSAKSSIDIEVEELSDYHTSDALKAALQAHSGMKVRVVLSNEALTTSGQSAVSEIKSAGGKLVTVANPYIHAKTIVVDGTTAYVGSENLSTGSLEYNRELGVIFSIPSEIQKIESTFGTDFAAGTAL